MKRRVSVCAIFAAACAFGSQPGPFLFFEPNRGQAHRGVEFLSHGSGVTAYLLRGEAVLRVGGSPVRLQLSGARPAAGEAFDKLPGVSSYFTGAPTDWHTGIPQYGRVRYRGVYPGIDMVYYGANGNLEYDFVVAARADASAIRLRYGGADTTISPDGALVLGTAGGELRQRRPVAYQMVDGERHEVAARYRIDGGAVRIELAAYDRARELVIDPLLEYGTFFGSQTWEDAHAVRVDSAGNVYVAGNANAPDSDANPFVVSHVGFDTQQAVVIKFSPATNRILYFVHIGGGPVDTAFDLAVDPSGAAYVVGHTSSHTFPVVNPFQAQSNVPPPYFYTGFLSKIAPDGKSLVYSTYLGGRTGEEAVSVAVDAAGSAVVTGPTTSADFPLKNAMFPAMGPSGMCGAFLTKFTPAGNALVFSTCFGGSQPAGPERVVLDAAGNIYVVGMTISPDFPTRNAYQGTLRGISAGFAMKVSADGQNLLYSTFLGGSAHGGLNAAGVDAAGNLYAGGWTDSSDFPTVNPLQGQAPGLRSGVLLKLAPAGNALVYSTYLGGRAGNSVDNLALDSAGAVWATGFTSSSDFPVVKPLFTNNADNAEMSKVIVLKLAPAGNTLEFSTVVPGSGNGFGIALDAAGAAYVAGDAYSADFPTKNPFQPTYGGGGDMFLLKIAPDAVVPVVSSLSASPSQLRFTGIAGGAAPAAQTVTVQVAAGAALVGFTTTVSTADGTAWLTATPASAPAPAPVTVSAAIGNLAVGTHTGTVRLTPADHSPAVDVAVTLIVQTAPPVLQSLTPTTISTGSPDTDVTVTGSGFLPGCTAAIGLMNVGPLPVKATYLNASKVSVTVPAVYLILANTVSVTVSNPDSAASNALIVTVGTPRPFVSGDRIYNAASERSTAVAPGTIVTIYGANLGPGGGVQLTLNESGRVSTLLAGTRVLFDGEAAPMVYTSSFQVSAVVPFSVATRQTTKVQVEYLGVVSDPVTVDVSETAPAIFTMDASGTGQGAILNADGSVNSRDNPAEPGSIVALWATGGGQTIPLSVDGEVTAEVKVPVLPVRVTVDGANADVLFNGAAPGMVAGALQVNLRVPAGARSGALPVVLSVGGTASPAGVTLAVK